MLSCRTSRVRLLVEELCPKSTLNWKSHRDLHYLWNLSSCFSRLPSSNQRSLKALERQNDGIWDHGYIGEYEKRNATCYEYSSFCKARYSCRALLLKPSEKLNIFFTSNIIARDTQCGGRRDFRMKHSHDLANKSDSKSAAASVSDYDPFSKESKLSLFAKFKLMYKKYWYVLIPVHVITSLGWMGLFYYLSKSGVNIGELLSYLNISEAVVTKMEKSNLGHWAVAYLCYKIATPFRYALTLGGTTASIKYLVQNGYLKPLPTKQEFIRMCGQKMAQRKSIESPSATSDISRQEGDHHTNKGKRF